MPNQIVLLHGWSDTSKSFRPLAAFLQKSGFEVVSIWLGDYISKADDVEIEDVVRRMQAVVQEKIQSGELRAPFDIICHSTGGLVSRDWLATYYPDGANCPLKRLIMLAPANFGSKLAHQGRSVAGRLFKGDWWQVGEEMLHSLELGSRYQWNLARRDLFDLDGDGRNPYWPGKVLPFVITGSRGFKGLFSVVNEDGSDSTVRASAANLNAEGATIDFAVNPNSPQLIPWARRAKDLRFPYALLPDREHSSIHQPEAKVGAVEDVEVRLGQLIIEALQCSDDRSTYDAVGRRWIEVTSSTNALDQRPKDIEKLFLKDRPDPKNLRAFLQLVTAVRDDQGFPVSDYVIEFYSPEVGGYADMTYFHSNVLKGVHQNRRDASRRCFYIDHSELITRYYTSTRTTLGMSLSAVNPGPHVKYFDEEKKGASGAIELHSSPGAPGFQADLLKPNSTHLIDIVIPRKPVSGVFKLTKYAQG